VRLHEKFRDELQSIMREGQLHELERLAEMYSHLDALRRLELYLETPGRRLAGWERRDIEAAREAFCRLTPKHGQYEECRVGLDMKYADWGRQHRPLALLHRIRDLFARHSPHSLKGGEAG
jgi:uncharacterized membrane protein YccC